MSESPKTSIEIDLDRCDGRLNCLRACPTRAIRTESGKCHIIPERCIDCGECITACPRKAIRSGIGSWDALPPFPFKVAIPSPTIYGQFPLDVTPGDITAGLQALGFDRVYDMSTECEMVNLALNDYLDEYKGRFPLISSTCAVVVRLIQVAYPEMVDQVVPLEPPREVAGLRARQLYASETGRPPEEIGIFYISPCPAKIVSVLEPAEQVKSHLDGAVGMGEIYNPLFHAITRLKDKPEGQQVVDVPMSRCELGWAMRGGQCRSLDPERFVSVSGLNNVIRILDQVEMGKIKGAEFLECYACLGGCIGGPLTVDDMFVSRCKLQALEKKLPEGEKNRLYQKAQELYPKHSLRIRRPLKARSGTDDSTPLPEKLRRMKEKEELQEKLPGLNCGLCGAPHCECFAEDVAAGRADTSRCLFLSDKRLAELRRIYGINPDK